MNSKHIIAAAIALASSAAFAQTELELQHFGQDQVSTASRTEVRADIARAQAAGELNTPLEVVVAGAAQKASLTARADRAMVRADVMKARAELSTPTEVTASAIPARAERSRQDVRAEARAFVRSGQTQVNVQAGF